MQCLCRKQRSETGKHMYALDLLSFLCIHTGANGFNRMGEKETHSMLFTDRRTNWHAQAWKTLSLFLSLTGEIVK